MRTIALLMVVGGTALGTLHGCGLSVVGEENAQDRDGAIATLSDGSPAAMADAASASGDGGEEGSGGLPDAARDLDAEIDASIPDAAPNDASTTSCSTCALVPPPGWKRVAYAADRNTACGGDLMTDDRVTEPAALAGACSCDCQIATAPDCNQGNFDSVSDNSVQALCNGNGVSRPANGGACTKASNSLANHRRAIPPAPVGGTCTGAGTAHQDRVTAASARVCAEAAGGKTCACEAGAGFKTCIRGPGDQACPAGYGTRTVVGGQAVVGCAATCGCSLTNVSCSGFISYFSDQACKSLIEKIDDKSCQVELGSSFNSYTWTGTPTATCTPGAAPTPTVVLDGAETICCP